MNEWVDINDVGSRYQIQTKSDRLFKPRYRHRMIGECDWVDGWPNESTSENKDD